MSSIWALVWLCLVQQMQSLPADNSPKEHIHDGTSTSCSQVKAFFVQNNLTEAQLTSQFITGSSLTICESSETCCTPSMETILLKGTSRAFRDALSQVSLSFKQSFASAATDVESRFVNHVKDSMQRTRARFAQLLDSDFTRFARGPIAELFKQLATYATTQPSDVDVSQSISTFFDDIYVYLHARDSPDYALCVRRTKNDLRPFGEIPRRLSLSVSRNLGAFRALLVSLRLATEAVAASSNADLTNECATALLRATSCAQCRGYSPTIRACHGLCANVARGCLAHVADINQPWNELLEYMEKTINFLTEGRSGPADILASIEDRLSEAVLHALENAPMLEKKVRKICGEPSTAAGSASTEGQTGKADDDSAAAHDSTSSSRDELSSRLRSLLPVLASARGFFATLPDLVCADKGNRFSNQADTQCWNGQRLDEYTKPVIGTGTSAQKYNPEVRVSRSDVDASFVQLSDKLRHARQMIMSKTTIAPDPDSLLMADFGSGSGDGDGDGVHWPTGIDPDSETPVSRLSPPRNDEDEGSGSGDGEITKDPYDPQRPRQNKDDNEDKDLDFDSEETTVRTTAKTPGSTGSLPSMSLLSGVVSIGVSIFCWGSLRWF